MAASLGSPVDYPERVIGKPFQMIGGTIESVDVKDIDRELLIETTVK